MASSQTYSFDSVGDTLPTLREHEKAKTKTNKVYFGPALPLRMSPRKSELFVMNTDLASQTEDNIKNILLTNRGERVMMPDFGANLKGILAEYGTAGFESEVMVRIKSTIKKYLPFVSLSDMKLNKLPVEQGSGQIKVEINKV
jgi:phage baseplate assembly protein W